MRQASSHCSFNGFTVGKYRGWLRTRENSCEILSNRKGKIKKWEHWKAKNFEKKIGTICICTKEVPTRDVDIEKLYTNKAKMLK